MHSATDPASTHQVRRWTTLVGVLIALLLTLHFLGDAEAPAAHSGESTISQVVDLPAADTGAAQAGSALLADLGHALAVGCGILVAACIALLILRILRVFQALLAPPSPQSPFVGARATYATTPARLRLCVNRV